MNNFDSARKGARGWWAISPSLRREWLPYGVLRAWREALGWTQDQMVMKIQEYLKPGKPDLKTYQRWEQGETLPQSRNFLTLRQMLRDQGKYVAGVSAVFDLGDFQIVQWTFRDPKSHRVVKWVLVNTRTYQTAQRMTFDNAFEEALELVRSWGLADGLIEAIDLNKVIVATVPDEPYEWEIRRHRMRHRIKHIVKSYQSPRLNTDF